MKHINIPVFIPHLGCPNNCVFCNQHSISGKHFFNPGSVDSEIGAALSTTEAGKAEVEVAFFGGSFTGIDRDLMIRLLSCAYRYVQSGRVSSIRLSTRPDYINQEILDILKQYHVTDIELGIQSLNDSVLRACRRGHTSNQAISACRMILENGFHLVGQMMIGLPCSSKRTEEYTAQKLCEIGVSGTRIYPLVIFKNTELADMTRRGQYIPLDEDEIIDRTARILEIFDTNHIQVLRIGLCAQENLTKAKDIAAGCYHEAIGEMVQSALFYKNITERLDQEKDFHRGKTLYIGCPVGCVSKVIGHKRTNLMKLRAFYGIKELKVIEKKSLVGYNITIN